ncbi:hypothetical protein C9I98_25435 [Photobacterium sanctipauli]|uniref:Uncharacterized protein n=1 Tax=Photobacterium sanctipauli TaxID=1342794 RepID=A0A2T3N982_9GAMM|nr:hypothetical protein [Photobacterium sanctipauli]PSW09970.1 hypothetical protein C9I98_25435 [Photobacterium sanctipauli]
MMNNKKLKQAFAALSQGTVCLDEHLRQGVLVYIEGLLIGQGIERDRYLDIEDLTCQFPYVRMSSILPIDFFGLNENPNNCRPCRDESFKPISLKVCSVSFDEHNCIQYDWHNLQNFRAEDIIEAIHALIDLLNNPDYFAPCVMCDEVRPSNYLDKDNVCECCSEKLLGAA